MSYASVVLEMSPSTGRFDTPQYVTVPAAHLRAVDVVTGRESELGGLSPGTLLAELDNSSRAYDPTNTASAHYPNLTPGKKVRLSGVFDTSAAATAITYVGIGAAAIGNNASVVPALPAGWAANDLLVIWASIRNTAGTVNVPTGWTQIGPPMGNCALLARIAVGGDTAPTVSFSGGVANATTIAHCAAWRGTERNLAFAVHAAATVSNASAQNVTLPGLPVNEDGCVVMALGWKQDDWTSVAALTGQGLTEIADTTTVTGDDASHAWDYKIETTATDFTTTVFTVTGGAAAVSRGVVLAIRPYRGTRSELFNGWTDSWAPSFSRYSGTTKMRASGAFKFLERTKMTDPYAAAVTAAGPTAWYRLGEGTGEVISDSSGNGLHGHWSSELAEVKATDGLIRSDDGAITLPAEPAIAIGKVPQAAVPSLAPLSVEFWLQLDKIPKPLTNLLDLSAENLSSVIAGGGVLVRVYSTDGTYPGALDFVVTNQALTNIAQADTTFAAPWGAGVPYWWYSICDGRPHHVVCTVNTGATVLSIWVDGVDRAQYNNFTGSAVSGASWALPSLNDANGWDGAAVLDELALYASEMDEATVLAHYTAGSAPWDGDRSGARVGNVLDLIGWPAALRDLDVGQSVYGVAEVGGSKALDYLELVANSEQGILTEAHHDGGKIRLQDRSARLIDPRSSTAQTFFSDDPVHIAFNSAVAYSEIALANDDHPAANVVTVKWRGGDYTVTDQASVDAYGEIPVSLDTILETAEEAANLGQWTLGEQASLFTRIRSITLRPSALTTASIWGDPATTTWAAALQRQEGDRVRVAHQPGSAGTVIDQQLWILGIEHHGANGVSDWSTTFHFGPAISTAYWILGTSLLGTSTRLSY